MAGGNPTIAVLPLGATEQHGPHLPPETDTVIAEAICRRAGELLPRSLNVKFLPAEPIGYSPEHLNFAATRSLEYSEAIERWIGIAEGLNCTGIRKFVMLNAHGGNSPLMTIVATELRMRLSILAVATSWTRFGLPEGVGDPETAPFDIHGGLIETSVMLALDPARVDMAAAKDFPSFQQDLAGRYQHLRAYGPHAFGWKITDLNADGACGDAAAATAEKGHAIIEHAATGFANLLKEVDRFSPPWQP